MKKYLGAVSFALLLLSPCASFAKDTDIDPEPSAQCVSLSQDLKYGSRDTGSNAYIMMLQDFLNSAGYLNATPTGFFG